MFFGRRFRFLMGPSHAEELLDRPLSNFDVLGIPTGEWSSGFFECFNNVVPSCVLSFFCPCVMWSQIVVRAQIPLLISLKNTLQYLRTQSGFGAFIEYFFWSIVVCFGLLLAICLAYNQMPSIVTTLLVILLVAVFGTLVGLLAHTRIAFREKYQLPSPLGIKGASFWDGIMDWGVMLTCLPCALAQMARHVFQYDKMDTELGLFLGDPSTLPPLRPTPEQERVAQGTATGAFERPALADEAGLHRERHGNANTGAQHRQEAIERRQREEIERSANSGATPTTAAFAPTSSTGSNASAPPIAQARVVR